MTTKIETFMKQRLKTDLPDIRPGDIIRIHQKIPTAANSASVVKATSAKEIASADKKERRKIQVFEGQVIAKKHGKGITSTMTVRKVISGIGVEKIFPLHSPIIDKIEVIKRGKAKRAKLYYLRKAKGKRAKLKREEVVTEQQ